jgi:tRNA(His) 5'-end guanylyltransferase
MATSKFNQLRLIRLAEDGLAQSSGLSSGLLNAEDIKRAKLAEFDARPFILPTKQEVINYLIWRQQDTTRNSISSVAQSMYSPKELHGKTCNDMQDMIFAKGINWNDYSPKLKRGRLIVKTTFEKESTTNEEKTIRTKWDSIDPEIFTSLEGNFLLTNKIPSNL